MKKRLHGLTSSRWALVAAASVALAGCGSTVQQTGSLAPGQSLPGQVGSELGGQQGVTSEPGTTTDGSAPGTSSTGTSSSTSTTSTGSAPAASAQGVGLGTSSGTATDPAATATGIPPTGRGWSRQLVYIGMTTQKDVNTVAQSAGVNSVDAGDQQGDAEAMIAELNAHGGLFGRQVKGVFFDVNSAGDGETQSQAACSFFTQDHPVIAIYAAALVADTATFRTCTSRARIPVFAGGDQAFDDKVFNDLHGYYNLMPFPSWSRFAPAFVDRLVAQNYFSGWNAALGQAGPDPVKTGILCPDTTVGRRVGAILDKELARVNRKPSDTIYYTTNSADVSGYVLKLQSDKVTHVMFCDLGLFVLATAAESQHYRPRYGVSTFNTPVLFLQGVVPAGQLNGAIGSGFIPTLDVDDSHDPKAQPAAAECRAVAAKHGITYPPAKRFARAVLYDTCDIFTMIVSSAKAGGGLDGPRIKEGSSVAGAKLRSATTFASGLSSTVHAMPAATRDILYDSPCGCFRYQDTTTRTMRP